MISDETLEEWDIQHNYKRHKHDNYDSGSSDFFDDRIAALIQAVRAERKCNAVLRELVKEASTDNCCLESKSGKENWKYCTSHYNSCAACRCAEFLAKEAEIRGKE